MAETDVHLNLLIALRYALKQYFRERKDVYVSGNIFLYYRDEQGHRKNVSPDILVVFGIEKKERRIYKLEDEGKAPDVVIELISAETKAKDLGEKRYIYATLGVKEYYLFDPLHETLQPRVARLSARCRRVCADDGNKLVEPGFGAGVARRRRHAASL